MKIAFARPWLKSAGFDSAFILAPAVISVAITFVLANSFGPTGAVPLWGWVALVVGIDVAHVYSTLFRTYFNSNEFNENKTLLTLIPIAVWLLGVALYSFDYLVFWSALAYVAVFHFIRQQYGFLRLYTRGQVESKVDRYLAAAIIYLSTIYPIIFWHSHEPRNFHWFIDGDFILGLPTVVSQVAGAIYVAVIILYCGNEIKNAANGIQINLPKNILIFGTAISWYMGIVHFNGDMAFTITNIISHGIPYMALVWIYGERQKDRLDSPLILGKYSYKMFFSKASVPLFLIVLVAFAYIEEGLWAGFIWRDHLDVFGVLKQLPHFTAKDTLSWLVPLLALPQATHYVLDGFIWKLKDSEANWQKVLFSRK